MTTLTITVKDDKTLKLIYDLEELDLIQVVDEKMQAKPTKLSDLLKGSISTEQAQLMQAEVKQMRDEWNRNTY
ncbi:hypothetical protein [Mucilaginibacter flavus]|uniref:hypothetical protein n=1 Tax=Mucilaginibacter flavus TaxID=931504 RepID=UPI0025B49A72|nr:hypothetical protein [Mucilaginibacter flavus]MDN3581217.1 hypothetical protein [Mucilaginibacter flavus]